MEGWSTQRIAREIELVEERLRELRLALVNNVEPSQHQELGVGDQVRVLNPNRALGQDPVAWVVKVNDESGFITVRGSIRGRKYRRKRKNLEKIEPGTQ